MAKYPGRPTVIPTFLDFPSDTCIHMVASILATYDMLANFSGHQGLNTLIKVFDYEAESVVYGLLPLVTSVDITPMFDSVPAYQLLFRHTRPFLEPPAPKAYSAWETAGEYIHSFKWRALEETYSKSTLTKMLNTVFAVLTYVPRTLRVEPRAIVRVNGEGYPVIEDGVSCCIGFNIRRGSL